MTFKEYIETRRVRNNIQGDFVKDARRDHQFPDVEEWSELKSYLYSRGSFRVVEAAQPVWAAYRAKLRRGHNRLLS